jgi:hypothetical protein
MLLKIGGELGAKTLKLAILTVLISLDIDAPVKE